MCGRFTLRHPRRVRMWGVPSPELFETLPRFNIAPSQKVWAITETRNGRELALFDWGLIPSWSKEPAGSITSTAELQRLLNPFPAEAMKSHPVSSDVNHPKFDGEHLVQRVDPIPEAQPRLF